MDLVNKWWFRIPIIFISSMFVLSEQKWLSIVWILISLLYFIFFFRSYIISDKEILLYDSLIYRGYIKDSQPIENKTFIGTDQISTGVLYLIICSSYVLVQNNIINVNNYTLNINNYTLLICSFIFVKFFSTISLENKTSFNAIQSYVYIGLIVLLVCFDVIKNMKSQGPMMVNQTSFKISIIITLIYLTLSPLVNTFNDVECSYFTNEQNCIDKSCVYKEDNCSNTPGSTDNTDNTDNTDDQNNSSPPCSEYRDESGCNSGNNCYYVKANLDRSEFSPEGITKADSKTECISEDNKCDDYSCNSEFYPLNIFDVCCEKQLTTNGCDIGERNRHLQDTDLDRLKNNSSDIKTLYGQEAWSKKVDYDESYSYCESKNRGSEMEAGFYA